MTKEMAKDIATALIAKSGEQFDSFAFEESDISEKDKQKIGDEIRNKCSEMIKKIETKYNVKLGYTTSDIIDKIMFE